jgi:hypothetical protein
MPGHISGHSSVCRSEHNAHYSVSSVSGANSYNWTITGGAQITSGQGSRHIRVRFTNTVTSPVTLAVTASNSCGTSAASTKNINVNMNCRIDANGELIAVEGNNLNAFSAYPNPTSGKTTITFTSAQDAKYSVRVVDLLGNVLIADDIAATEGYNSKEIDLQNVAKGLYFITIQGEGEEAQTIRLVVE